LVTESEMRATRVKSGTRKGKNNNHV